ncbi:MAG: hypothetical protein HYX80_09320 [Chloroflexi bacterium]|nr:hypothetical protein [Chloroflexota bacterium]
MTELSSRVGEVIEASTVEFVAQCYELYRSPPLGSLVKTADENAEQYGIVYNVTTSSIEPGRRPIARGKDEANEADIYSNSPQLAKLLRTEFSAILVGHRHGAELRYYLPPHPPRIHSFVYQCQSEEVKEFSRAFEFLPMLVGAQLPVPVEEVVAACLRQMSREAEDPHRFLVTAGKELAVLLGNDFNRLKAILGRIRAG